MQRSIHRPMNHGFDRLTAACLPRPALPLPHHHELLEDLPEAPEPWQGHRPHQKGDCQFSLRSIVFGRAPCCPVPQSGSRRPGLSTARRAVPPALRSLFLVAGGACGDGSEKRRCWCGRGSVTGLRGGGGEFGRGVGVGSPLAFSELGVVAGFICVCVVWMVDSGFEDGGGGGDHTHAKRRKTRSGRRGAWQWEAGAGGKVEAARSLDLDFDLLSAECSVLVLVLAFWFWRGARDLNV